MAAHTTPRPNNSARCTYIHLMFVRLPVSRSSRRLPRCAPTILMASCLWAAALNSSSSGGRSSSSSSFSSSSSSSIDNRFAMCPCCNPTYLHWRRLIAVPRLVLLVIFYLSEVEQLTGRRGGGQIYQIYPRAMSWYEYRWNSNRTLTRSDHRLFSLFAQMNYQSHQQTAESTLAAWASAIRRKQVGEGRKKG